MATNVAQILFICLGFSGSILGRFPSFSPSRSLSDELPNTSDLALNPLQILLISSSALGKVLWTKLHNFESVEGRTFPLIAEGLVHPRGIALDRKHGYLYVADYGASAIFCYHIVVDTSGSELSLTTTHERLRIVEGYSVEWVALDDAGDLFFTSPHKNSINKIEKTVLDKLFSGEWKTDSFKVVSENALEAEKAQTSSFLAVRPPVLKSLVMSRAEPKPRILSIYDELGNAHVSSPEAIWVDGLDLYWSNRRHGDKSGSIVKGQAKPVLNSSATVASKAVSFSSSVLTQSTVSTFGFMRVDNLMYFSGCGSNLGTCSVFVLKLNTGEVLPAVGDITSPRGMISDGDNTIYVADEGAGGVWAFPGGRFMENVPLVKAVSLEGAFGLAMLSQRDPFFRH